MTAGVPIGLWLIRPAVTLVAPGSASDGMTTGASAGWIGVRMPSLVET